MITLRAKPLSNGKFSLFIDMYHSGYRSKEYLQLYTSVDYCKNPYETDKNGNIVFNSKGIPKPVKPLPIDAHSWKLANDVLQKKILEFSNEAHGKHSHFKQDACFIKYFENACKVKNHDTYDLALGRLKKFYTGNILPFKAITVDFLNDFKAYLLKDLSCNASYTYLHRLHIVWNDAMKKGITDRNPFIQFEKPKRNTPKREYLTHDEVKLLAETIVPFNTDVKQAFLFCCFTGLRISDVKKLLWTDIKNNEIQIRQTKNPTEPHTIPLSETALHILEARDKTNKRDKVFNRLPSDSLCNYYLKQWAQLANLDKRLHWHSSRHTFATMHITFGTDIYTISKLLGHHDISVTQVYSKVVDKKKIEAINNLPNDLKIKL